MLLTFFPDLFFQLSVIVFSLLYLSWGRNQNGQLGLGTIEDSLVPQKIQAFQVLVVS